MSVAHHASVTCPTSHRRSDGVPRGTRFDHRDLIDFYWSFSTWMRWSDVARDMLSSAPVAPVVLVACPLLLGLPVLAPASFMLPDVGEFALAPDVSVDVPLVVPLVGSFVVSFDVPLPDGPVGLLAPPDVEGRFSSTSPLDVPVVVPLGAALPVDGTQFAALVAPLVVLRAAAEVSAVDGVGPVPLAPLVVFRPVNR